MGGTNHLRGREERLNRVATEVATENYLSDNARAMCPLSTMITPHGSGFVMTSISRLSVQIKRSFWLADYVRKVGVKLNDRRPNKAPKPFFPDRRPSTAPLSDNLGPPSLLSSCYPLIWSGYRLMWVERPGYYHLMWSCEVRCYRASGISLSGRYI